METESVVVRHGAFDGDLFKLFLWWLKATQVLTSVAYMYRMSDIAQFGKLH